jgi:hypothetical protein
MIILTVLLAVALLLIATFIIYAVIVFKKMRHEEIEISTHRSAVFMEFPVIWTTTGSFIYNSEPKQDIGAICPIWSFTVCWLWWYVDFELKHETYKGGEYGEFPFDIEQPPIKKKP